MHLYIPNGNAETKKLVLDIKLTCILKTISQYLTPEVWSFNELNGSRPELCFL